ncbi:MAG TPA: hybrid sensor histidine kinase/response regulator [Acidimicrobiales bacterium]|nr:hybrid sensor histidine kinase/response regulator [Acidimicrobiales bacterium]
MNAPAATAQPKVLLVDDREDNLVLLEAVLEPLGLELVMANSGAEALGALLVDEFAVVVLDVQMPDMDGFETARLIKGRERTRLVPIIFLTAISNEPHHHLAGYQVGAVDYIGKPFDADILRAKVSVFAELWRRGQTIDAQRAALAEQVKDIERLNGQLERSNAVLDSFAARAAEDLLEPLDAIAGYLELITERHPELSNGDDDLVTRATKVANSQRERVAALLDYADAGAVRVDVATVDLAAAIEEACARAGLSLGGATVQIATGSQPEVHGDRQQIVRLLELLIDRAVRRAGASTVTVEVERDGGGVIVRVRDDGKRITAPEAAAMFDGRTNLAVDDPAVVGLVVSRRIVERHGGTIWATPQVDAAGTEIDFTLPDGSNA